MRAPYTQLYLHLVWSTWDRLPLITSDVEQRLYAAIVSKAEFVKCAVIAIGGDVDHVHLLVRFPTTIAVAELVKLVKGSSSHLMNHEIAPDREFKWQGAYGAFTISKTTVDKVADYVRDQKLHHANRSLIEELECSEADDLINMGVAPITSHSTP
jgi:REP element-mobilizing transposase RayT